MTPPARVLLAVLTVLTAVAGCTRAAPVTATTTATTATTTAATARTTAATPSAVPTTAVPDFVVPAPSDVAASGPGSLNPGESVAPCPYIASSQDQGSNSMADLEGDRIYKTTVLSGYSPPGCRFYFWAPPYEAVADIEPYTLDSSLSAHNAMVRIAATGTDEDTHTDIAPGVDAILFRTRFLASDAGRDWACVFAAGNVVVIVHTQQVDVSYNVLRIATQIAPQF